MRRSADLRLVLGAGILTLPSSALAQQQHEQQLQQQQQAASEDAEKEKKVCRSEKMTGSLTRRNRICMTVAQWRELSDRTRRGIDEMHSAAAGGKVCHPDPADPFHGCPG